MAALQSAPEKADQHPCSQGSSGVCAHCPVQGCVWAASVAALNEVGLQRASNSLIASAPLVALLLHLQQHLGSADGAGAPLCTGPAACGAPAPAELPQCGNVGQGAGLRVAAALQEQAQCGYDGQV